MMIYSGFANNKAVVSVGFVLEVCNISIKPVFLDTMAWIVYFTGVFADYKVLSEEEPFSTASGERK